MFAIPFLFFGLFLVLVVVLVFAGHAQAKARRERFAAFAGTQGWDYSVEKQGGLEDRFPELEFFQRGSNRYGENFLGGTWAGYALTAFDYHYQTSSGSGKNRRTHHHRFTMVLLQPPFPLKPLVIRREHLLDGISAAFGWNDIDFESAGFSDRYHVTSPDRRWAFDVINARTMALLLDRDAGAMHLDHLRLMMPLQQVKDPAEILPACETAAALLDGIPDYARQTPPSLPPPLPPTLPPPRTTMEFLILPAALGLIGLIWFIGTYNGLIRLRNHCRESWADIDTELKRRHDLIPRLVETVKGYAAHEQQLFADVTASRARAASADHTGAHVRELGEAENELLRGLRRVIAVAEAYPALKADAQFLRLQQELVNTEDRIQASRRFFNANVRDLNNRVESIPSSLVAGMAGIGKAEFFEVEDLAIRAPAAVGF